MKKIFIIIIYFSLVFTIIDTTCDICISPITNHYFQDAWGNKYHEHHLKEGTFCGTCSRIICKRITKGGFQFNDGRIMCNLCEANIIKTENDKTTSLNFVLENIKKRGVEINKNSFKVNLVDRKFLQLSAYSLANHKPETVKAITILDKNQYVINILWGLNQLEFESVLAHEFFHIWVDYHNIKLYNAKLEGFCNLGSALIYDRNNTQLSGILLQSLMKNEDPIYGQGYKYMNAILKKYGWDGMIMKLLNENHNW